MTCKCIEVVNEMLAKSNTQVHLPMFVLGGSPKPFVETVKVDEKKRGKPAKLFASYCPFCGVAYDPKPETVKAET